MRLNLENMPLGRIPSLRDSRDLLLANYITRSLPAPPASIDWSKKVKTWPMMINDRIGDCTIAAAGHLVETWTANESKAYIIPDKAIVAAYSAVSGYNPVTGANDDGAMIRDVLNLWRKSGIGGHKIDAYASVTPHNHVEMNQAAWLFGGTDLGIDMPGAWQRAKIWDTGRGASYQPGSWGGHSVPVVAYDAQYVYAVTWGYVQRLTWRAVDAYVSEAWAPVSRADWITDGKSPSGFDALTLFADLKQIT